jgi:hypothetical protein
MTTEELNTLKSILTEPKFRQRHLFEAFARSAKVTEEPEKEGTKTRQQEKSYHLWLRLVAEELDKHGHTIQDVVAQIKHAEIHPTGKNLKEVMWRPYQMAAVQKESTTKLNKAEVDKIYEGLNKFLGEHFHIHVPFPNDEARQLEELAGPKLAQHNNMSNESYPEHTESPAF